MANKTRSEASLAREREAEALFVGGGLDAVVKEAWRTHDAGTLKALERVLRREGASDLARTFDVYDWARKEGFTRENLRLDHDLDVAAFGLAMHGDPRIVPFIAGLVRKSWVGTHLLEPWLESDRIDTSALLERARAWLEERNGIDELDLAAMVIQRFGDASDAPALAKTLDQLLADIQMPNQGFASAMTKWEAYRTIELLTRALVAHGVPASLGPVLRHVLASDNYSLHRHRGHVAPLLARMGTGLDLVLAHLDQAMAKPDDAPRIRAGVFSAIASLAERESPDRKNTLRTKLSAVPVQAHPLAEVDRRVALRSLGADISLSPALELALTYKSESDDGAVWTRLAALDLVATRSDVPATLAIPLVHCSNVRLHRAAVRALRGRKHPVPEVKVYDPLTVAELVTRGPEALANALSDDRGLAREHIVFALDRDSIVQLRAPLEAFAHSLTRATLVGPNAYALRWTIQALAMAPGSEPLFDELLTSCDEKVVEAVLRNANAIPSGIERGMTSALTRMSNWKKREAAAWLQKHPSEATTRALSELGLAPEDLKWMSKTH